MKNISDMTRTKLLSSKKDLERNPFAGVQFNEILSPIIEPATETDTAAIDQLLSDLGCLSDRPTANAKIRVLLSSFLMQSQRLENRVERKGGRMIIGWPHDEAYWRVRSKVGYKIAIKLREAMIKHGWISHQVGAEINLFEGNGNCHGYLISDFVPSKAVGISFQSSAEVIYATKSSAKKTRVVDTEVDQRTKDLWALWKQTPLTYLSQKMWTAYRSFSDAKLTKGGRLYGQWSSMRKAERLKCTIGGQPVAEVDVSGMYLTLLCSISGHVPFKTRFKDPYEVDGIDRSEVKAVINSAIGGGTWKQTQPTKMITKVGISQRRLTEIRKAIIPKYECLKSLDKYLMYSETLAIQEAEIMMRLVERLQQPIFILHDCLICQKDNALAVGNELQKQYVSYCAERGWTPIAPAFSIETKDSGKKLISGHRNPFIISL